MKNSTPMRRETSKGVEIQESSKAKKKKIIQNSTPMRRETSKGVEILGK